MTEYQENPLQILNALAEQNILQFTGMLAVLEQRSDQHGFSCQTETNPPGFTTYKSGQVQAGPASALPISDTKGNGEFLLDTRYNFGTKTCIQYTPLQTYNPNLYLSILQKDAAAGFSGFCGMSMLQVAYQIEGIQKKFLLYF